MGRQKRLGGWRGWKVMAALGVSLAALLVVSGLSGLLPLGQETTLENGVARTALVLNPETGSAAWSDCEQGTLKITIPVFDIVYSQPSPGASVAGIIQRGDLVSVKGRNADGWWNVYLPGSCTDTGWTSAEAFQTVKLAIPEATPAITPTASPTATPTPEPTPAPAPTAMPAATPTGTVGVSGTGSIVVASSLTMRLASVAGANGLGVVSDDGTRFTLAVETNAGSTFEVRLALKNASGQPLVGQLDLALPAGVQVSATKADAVTGIGQVGVGSWKFTMAAAGNNLTPDIILSFRVAPDAPPGFGTMSGTLRQTAY